MKRSRPTRAIRLVAVLFSLSLVLTACDPEQLLRMLDGQAATQASPADGAPADEAPADEAPADEAPGEDKPDEAAAPAKGDKTEARKPSPAPAPTATPKPKPDRQKPPTDDGGSGGGANLSAVERDVFDLLNTARAKAGLKALKLNAGVATGARAWSCEMARTGNFRHADLQSAGVNGENIAWGQRSAGDVHQGWMNSPGHNRNRMNSRWTEYGIGVCKDGNGRMYFTERFR